MNNIITKSRSWAAMTLFIAAFLCLGLTISPATGQRDTGGGNDNPTSISGAVEPRVLHFHGNTEDPPVAPGAANCTGVAPNDVTVCNGPFLTENATLSTNPAAKWVINSAVGGANNRTLYDTSWVWRPAGPTQISGTITIEWWADVNAEAVLLGMKWDIRLSNAIGGAYPGPSVFKEAKAVVATPPTAGVPAKLTATLTDVPLTDVTNGMVLTIEPSFSDTGANSHIWYDSTQPCPGAAAGPCDSTITIGAPTTTPTPTPTPTATPTATPSGDAPRFINYYAPPGWLERAGEPTIGINWKTENVSRPKGVNPPAQTFQNTMRNGVVQTIGNGGTSLYYGGINPYFLRANFDDCSSPAQVDWAQIPIAVASRSGAPGAYDPILFTDHWTGRTFVCQEFGLTPAGSSVEWTDNDGDNMWLSEGAAPSGGIDHQTIGGGPFHAPTPPTVITPMVPTSGGTPIPNPGATPYPHGVWYASQNVASATSQTSVDGGFSFPTNNPMFTASDCAGLHGHIKVAEDGTLFVPDRACSPAGVPFVFGGHPAVAVSEDNGATWNLRPVPSVDSDAGIRDPSVGVSWCPPGTCSDTEKAERSKHIYLGFGNTSSRPHVAYSNNKGQSWVRVVDLGAISGIKHGLFYSMVVGDPDRASLTFLGTKTEGSWFTDAFPGVWHLYAATTYDGGQTWDVKNLSPEGPIQRGGVCNGTSEICRNLLDFQDTEVDKQGRILIAGQDGCVSGCELGGPNSFTAKAFISRQSGGKRLFSIYDSQTAEPRLPEAPGVTGGIDAGKTKVTLTWRAPDDGGSPITHYNIYRADIPNPDWSMLSPLAAVSETNYMDTALPAPDLDGNIRVYYIVTAVNGIGEGPFCKVFHPEFVIEPTPCELPGVLVNNDVLAGGADDDAGTNTPPDGRVNVRQSYVAEPFVSGQEQLVFTLQVVPSTQTSAPPNSQWFIIWKRQGTDPADSGDSNYDRMYVAMATDAVGTVRFDYGKFGVPRDPLNPNPNFNTPKKFGIADAGSSYTPATGVIRIVLSKSKLRAIDGGSTKYQPGSDLIETNVRTYFNRPDYQPDANPPITAQRSQDNASDITGSAPYSLRGNASCAPQAQLLSAVSRKTHGSSGPTFGIGLFPQVGNAPAIEPRRGGNPGNHQVVMVFPSPVTFSGATSSSGTASTSPPPNSAPTSEVTVNLSNVPNAQVVTVTLQGVTAGAQAADFSVQMRVLLGDVNVSDNAVNSGDAQLVRNQSGQLVDGDNFRSDVNLDGVINSGDAHIVRNQSGTGF